MEIHFHPMNSGFTEFSLQMKSAILSRHERQALALAVMGLSEAADIAWNWYQNRKNMVIYIYVFKII